MNFEKRIVISGPSICTENGMMKNIAIGIENGKIQKMDLLQELAEFHATELLHFPSNYFVVPGFIDLHTHGANGFDVMDANEDALFEISRALAKEGTTGFLATTMTAEVSEITNTLATIKHYSKKKNLGAKFLGVHLEGPFLAESKMGAQPGDKIIPPNVALMHDWIKASDNLIKLVTLAPEQPKCLELIRFLRERGIVASIGHTNATYDQTVSAIEAGCTHATHLFNAMSGLHHREPGAVTAALLADTVLVELILDGVHLHPAVVELALKLKGKNRVVLVTDAMRAKCLREGCYDLGGQDVTVKNGEAKLANGTLAGSILEMPTAIKNILEYTGCSLEDAVKMASENPAKVLHIFDQKGSLQVGKDADLVVLNDQLEVVLTLCEGSIVYEAESAKVV